MRQSDLKLPTTQNGYIFNLSQIISESARQGDFQVEHKQRNRSLFIHAYNKRYTVM